MIEFLKNWVLTIITLALFIVLLEIIIPSGKTKKFINLVSGFILIISIINPILSLSHKGIDFKQFQIKDSNFIDRKEISKNSEILKDSQMKQITNTYRNKIIRQIGDALDGVKGISDVRGDVIINEDYKSDSFGEIKRIYVYFNKEEDQKNSDKNSGIKEVEKVQEVKDIKIDGNTKQTVKAREDVKIDKKLEEEIEARINKILGVDRDNIVIAMEEP